MMRRISYPERFVKRTIDITGALALLLLSPPFFIILAACIKSDGGPILFIQRRIGREGKIFPCYKFRTMIVHAEEFLREYVVQNHDARSEWEAYQKLKDDPRVTPAGKFIRRFSLDELPQIFNVLRGDMSLVGPRPITPEQQVDYGESLIYYDAVQPGITGPWQVNGRNRLTFAERIVLETEYVKKWNLFTDFRILLKTIPVIFSK